MNGCNSIGNGKGGGRENGTANRKERLSLKSLNERDRANAMLL